METRAARAPRPQVHFDWTDWPVYREFRAQAARQGVPIRDLVAEAMREWLDKRGITIQATKETGP